MKKTVLSAAIALLASAPLSALAADSWAGPYAGASVAMSSFSSQFQDIDDEWDNQGVNGNTESTVLFGVNAGWNFQDENFVYGVELGYTLGDGTSESKPYGVSDPALIRSELGDVISLKGKVGIASGSTLAYVAAGLAQADIDGTANTGTAGADQSSSDTVDGFTFAVGVEHKFANNVLLRVQGESMKLETTANQTLLNGNMVNATSEAFAVSLGAGYKF